MGEGGASGLAVGGAEASIDAATDARAGTGTKGSKSIRLKWYAGGRAADEWQVYSSADIRQSSKIGRFCALATPEKSARVANAVAPKSNFLISVSILDVCPRA